MLKILQTDKEYENNLKQYTKRDGILSFVLFGIMILNYSILAVLQTKFEFIKENIMLVGCIFNTLMIVITVLFIKLNKQSLETIGLYKGKWKNSIIMGIVFASFLFYNNCLSYLINGSHFITLQEILMLLVYYFLVAVCEEIVFRGYIGTRIYGLIKKRWLTVFVVGILFIAMHFPYRMLAYGMTLSDLTIKNFSWIIDLFITHLVLSFIYLKTNSLYGAIIPHWMSNFAYNIILK
mgnify:FL=1